MKRSLASYFTEEDLPWYLNPNRARIPLPQNIDPAVAAALANMSGDEAEEDKYADMLGAEVPEWGQDLRTTDERVQSYVRQMLENPGEFAVNYDEKSKTRNTKIPMMIYLLQGSALQGSKTPAELRKIYAPQIPARQIHVLKPLKRYSLLPLILVGSEWMPQPALEVTFPPHGIWVAIPLEFMHDFITKTGDGPGVKQYQVHDAEVFLIQTSKYPQTYYDSYHSKAYGQI